MTLVVVFRDEPRMYPFGPGTIINLRPPIHASRIVTFNRTAPLRLPRAAIACFDAIFALTVPVAEATGLPWRRDW